MEWQIAEAKNRFSEVVDRAMSEGSQHVSRRGKPAVVVLSETEYQSLRGPKKTFIEHLLEVPDLAGVDLSDLDITRDDAARRPHRPIQ